MLHPYSVDPNDALFYRLTLAHIGSNGSLTNNYYYDIFNFTLASASQDKTFVFNQDVPAAVWDITHNLGKFPSVSAVDTQKTIYWGNVNYISTNRLTITFTSAFAGQAFLN